MVIPFSAIAANRPSEIVEDHRQSTGALFFAVEGGLISEAEWQRLQDEIDAKAREALLDTIRPMTHPIQ
jgi:hypothetical protein